jgi:succinyl-CoA synthetase beta subunit
MEICAVELHEYQVKSLLGRFGVPSPAHLLLEQGVKVEAALSRFGFEPLCVKAQVPGRKQKAAAERSVNRPRDLIEAAKSLLGSQIITSTSGPQGFTASKVIVMSAPTVVKQFLFRLALMPQGDVQMSINEQGGKIFSELPFEGFFRSFQLYRLASSLGIRPPLSEIFRKVIEGAIKAFFYFDAVFLEIDSLALTENGIFQALDARMVIDDDALFRQPELFHMADRSQRVPKRLLAPHVCFDMGGPIGCVSNGDELALGSADLVSLSNGIPGKVVDIGVDVDGKNLIEGLKMVQDEHQKVVFVNLFTGLADGEKIAEIIKKEQLQIPMVIRLEGTNGAGGRLALKSLEPMCFVTDSQNDAARHAVALAALAKS